MTSEISNNQFKASTGNQNKITLALGGGVALGWAHIGVLKALEKAGIEIAAIAGTSIGALVGGAYLAGHLTDLEEFARSTNKLKILQFLDLQIHGQGLLGGETVVKELNKYLGGLSIEDLSAPYAAIAADLIKGKEIVSLKGPLVDAIRASISLPGLFTPVQQGGQFLVDGGMVNPLPVSAARKLSSCPVVAIDVTGDYFGRAESLGIKPWDKTNLLPAKSVGANRTFSMFSTLSNRLFKRKSDGPNLIATATASYALLVREMTQAQLKVSPADLHIVPKIGHVSMIEFDRADELIEAGEMIIEEKLTQIRSISQQKTSSQKLQNV